MRYGEKNCVNLSMSQNGEGWKGPIVGHVVGPTPAHVVRCPVKLAFFPLWNT